MNLESLQAKLLVAIVLLVFGASGGAWSGYRIGHAAADRAAAAAATQLARDNAATVDRLRSDNKTAVAAVQAQLDRQTAATAQWLAINAQLATQVSGLQKEIDHAVFTVAPARGAPACPVDPVGSAEFRRLYDRAAAAGAGAPPAVRAPPGSG